MSQFRHYVSIVSAPSLTQSLTAFCKEAASTGGPSRLMCRKEWCCRWKFSWISTHNSCVQVAKSQAVTRHFVLQPSRSSVRHKRKRKCFNESHEQFVCAAVGWHSCVVSDWLKLLIDYILMILNWLVRSAVSHGRFQAGDRCSPHRLTVHGLDIAITRCLIWPPSIYYMLPLFCGIFTLNTETTHGELPGWNSIPRTEKFNPCILWPHLVGQKNGHTAVQTSRDGQCPHRWDTQGPNDLHDLEFTNNEEYILSTCSTAQLLVPAPRQYFMCCELN